MHWNTGRWTNVHIPLSVHTASGASSVCYWYYSNLNISLAWPNLLLSNFFFSTIMVRQCLRIPNSSPFFNSSLVRLWAGSTSLMSLKAWFQFYISTILLQDVRRNRLLFGHISILHKYDYKLARDLFVFQMFTFQFYESTIIILKFLIKEKRLIIVLM